MQYFIRYGRYLLAGLGLACALPALAAGTDAGVSVDNAVTLNYSVNGGAQPTQTDTVSFVVDRKLDLLVTSTETDWVTVTIGQPYAGLTGVPALNYSVTNQSNAPINVVLGVVEQGLVQVTGLPAQPGGSSAFASDSFIVAISEDGNGTYDAGTDTIVALDVNGYYDLTPYLPGTGELGEDESVNIMIVAAVPDTATADQYDTFTLVAAVAEDPGTGFAPIALDDSGNISPGSGATPDDIPNDLGTVESVFADIASGNTEDVGFDFFAPTGSTGSPDVDYDGQGSDSNGFIVTGVDLLVAKYAEVVYDPVSGNAYTAAGAATGAQPKAIPGAVIMYVIGVANQDVDFTAENITITDDVDVGPVVLGNDTGDTVYNPVSVTVDLNPAAPGTNTQIYTLPAALDIDAVYTEDCGGLGVSAGYGADPAEVAPAIFDCAPTSTGYVVYFVTVEAAG